MRGRLRQSKDLEPDMIHPLVLDPKHPLTQLLIKEYDQRLFHPGPDRVFAEICRLAWNRLWKPPFWSTGVDCFGPLNIEVGHRVEKQ